MENEVPQQPDWLHHVWFMAIACPISPRIVFRTRPRSLQNALWTPSRKQVSSIGNPRMSKHPTVRNGTSHANYIKWVQHLLSTMSRGLDRDNIEVSCRIQNHFDGEVLDTKPPTRGLRVTNGLRGSKQRFIHTSTTTSDQPASDIHFRYDKWWRTFPFDTILTRQIISCPALATMASTNETP
jgi:hypothetical protein